MSYHPGGAPAEVLRLALALAEEARLTSIRFEEEEELSNLGSGVEALLPLIDLVDELRSVLTPASERWEFWERRRD